MGVHYGEASPVVAGLPDFNGMVYGGVPEGAPIEIAWNSKVGRYQEYAANEDPVGFKPELKNPPHIRTGGNKGLVVQSPTPR